MVSATDAITAQVGDGAAEFADEPATARLSRRRLLVRRFFRNRTAVVGLVIFTLLVLIAIFGPLFVKWSHTDIDRTAYLQPPSREHWLGTTSGGFDVLSWVLEGLRTSMMISITVAVGSTAIAAIVGSFAAYFGNWTERGLMWLTDLLLVVPNILIIAIVMRNVTSNMKWWLALWLVALGWMLSARVVRSLTMSVRDREYVTAAKYMGVPAPRIIVRHILPNISSLLIIDATLAVVAAILAETTLSFLGFGIRYPEVSLGMVIREGQTGAVEFPWIFGGAGTALVLLAVSVNFIGDGLRDAFDPSSKAGGKA